MRKHYKEVFVLLLFFIATYNLNAQGCVAIRGNSGGENFGNTVNLMAGEFNVQSGFRYFKSFRHFRGDHEESNRVAEGTNVINRAHFVDLSISYGITDRLYADMIIPYSWITRSSLYEHGGNSLGDRHETSSQGVGDFRAGIGYWLFKPGTKKFNYAVGLGIKLPTGRYDYTDTFYLKFDNIPWLQPSVLFSTTSTFHCTGTDEITGIQGFRRRNIFNNST